MGNRSHATAVQISDLGNGDRRSANEQDMKGETPYMRNYPKIAPRRLAAGDSLTFLMKELEKIDETILEPLSGTD